MSRLRAQHQRLFQSPEDAAPALGTASTIRPNGQVRSLVIALHSPADWAALAPLWRGVQAEFGWPEPAIAVNGSDAFELWFSLAEPLPSAQAAELVVLLQRRYLGGVRAERLRAWPLAEDAASDAPACPPFNAGPERWAAFVTPDLPAVFGDDPALDFEPGADAQAELLARLRPVSGAELRRALAALTAPGDAAPAALAPPAPAASPLPQPATPPGLPTIGPSDDPRVFLTAVMNDATVPLALRIEAAKGLLQAPGR